MLNISQTTILLIYLNIFVCQEKSAWW